MASEANASSSHRCCDLLKELLKPFFGRRTPAAPPAQSELGSTLLEEPVPACQRELKQVVASVRTAEAPNQQQMPQQMPQVLPQVTQEPQQQVAEVAEVAEVARRAYVPKPPREGPPCLINCLRALRANVGDVQMALAAAEEPKNDFFSSAIILGGPSGMATRPLLCVEVTQEGIECEGSTPFCGVAMLMLPFNELEETLANWPDPKEHPQELEQMEKEQKELVKAKYSGGEGARASREFAARLEVFEHAMNSMHDNL